VPLVALALTLAWLTLRLVAWTPPGFTRSVHPELGERGAATVSRADDVDLAFMAEPHGPRRFFSTRWRGVWHVDDAGDYVVYLGADDWARLTIDGTVLAERSRTLGYGAVAVPLRLTAGTHTIDIQHEQEGGSAFVTAGWSRPGEPIRPFARAAVFPSPVSGLARAVNQGIRGIGWLAVAAIALAAAMAVVAGLGRLRRAAAADARGWRGIGAHAYAGLARRERWLSAAGLILVLALAGAMRLDAIMVRYGPFDRPGWLVETEIHTRERIERIRPDSFSWSKIAVPYVGGDPINYLAFGRVMTSFYEAHVREPMFPAAVHVWLWLLGDHDVGVSFASAMFSFLAVAGTWWLGRMAYGAWVGVIAAFGLAMDKDAITWAADGWRDDTVLFFAVAVAIALLGLARRPTWTWTVALGVCAAGAILTRVTALSLVVPGLLAVAWLGQGPWVVRVRALAVASVIAFALAAPYYYNCWREFGDPLYPINVHTSFYRARAGEAGFREPMSVGAYLRGRATKEPVETAKTGLIGLFWFPFENKWVGFDYYYVGLRRFLMGMAAVGLVLMATTRRGWFLWGLLLLTLLPYAFTWSIKGGGEWRFTLPAYPFYLIAAALALVTTARHLPTFASRLTTAMRR
jgi:hypothetical protein